MSKEFVKQHIVPVSYLDRFADPDRMIGTRLIEKDNKVKLFKTPTKDVGYIKNFYDVTDKNDPKYWEHYLADQIDTLYGRELGNIISRVTLSCNEKIVLGEYEKNTLSKLIVAQMMRIPDSVEYIKTLYKRVIPEIKAEAIRALPKVIRDKYEKKIANWDWTDQWKKEQFFNHTFNPENFERYCKVLHNRLWIIYVNDVRHSVPFVTGDNPVLIEGIGKTETGLFNNGLIASTTCIFFPVTPSIAIANYSKQGFFSPVADDMDGKKIIIGENDIPFILDRNMKIIAQSYKHSFISQPFYDELIRQ